MQEYKTIKRKKITEYRRSKYIYLSDDYEKRFGQ